MKKSILALLAICAFFLSPATAFDALEILTPHAVVKKSGFFKTQENLTPHQALKYADSDQLEALPKKAKSFGFDRRVYWFYLEIDTESEGLYLEYRNNVAQTSELFVFKNQTLQHSEKNGLDIPLAKRSTQTLQQRFTLLPGKAAYLLKVHSNHPLYFGLAIGNQTQLQKPWDWVNFAYIFTFGVFSALILYNLFLYLSIRDSVYIYYILYMVGLFAYSLISIGYYAFLPNLITQNTEIIVIFSFIIMYTGLIFFTIRFLRLHSGLKKMLITLLSVYIILSFALFVGYGKELFTLIKYLLLASVLYVGITQLQRGDKIAKYFLFSTGIGVLFLMLYHTMNTYGSVEFGYFSINALNIAIIWDLTTLSLALAYRIRLSEYEKQQQQALLIQQSKMASMGEMIGMITHQWKQPLNALAIRAQEIDEIIEFEDSDKELLIKVRKDIQKQVHHMSDTMRQFQTFFKPSKQKSTFDICPVAEEVKELMAARLKNLEVEVTIHKKQCFMTEGYPSELKQVYLNLISNACDVFEERKCTHRKIDISTHRNHHLGIIKVRDTGGGIPTALLPEKLFEAYVSTKGDRGTGIGLQMSKLIIEDKHKGRLSAHNVEGGAEFIIELPAVDSQH